MTDETQNEEEEENREAEESMEGAGDALLERAEDAVEQANEMHRSLDSYNEWASTTSGNIAGRAEALNELDIIDDETAVEIIQMAQRIRTVYQRIEG